MRVKLISICIILAFLLTNCSTASKLSGKSDADLASLDETVITNHINIYHGFNRCTSYDVQRLKKEIIRRHPDWDEKSKGAILNCEIYKGMSAQQVAASWGAPEYAPMQETTVWTKFETWNYSAATKKVKLRFENKKLAEIVYEK